MLPRFYQHKQDLDTNLKVQQVFNYTLLLNIYRHDKNLGSQGSVARMFVHFLILTTELP
jgi:hypothetical protein